VLGITTSLWQPVVRIFVLCFVNIVVSTRSTSDAKESELWMLCRRHGIRTASCYSSRWW